MTGNKACLTRYRMKKAQFFCPPGCRAVLSIRRDSASPCRLPCHLHLLSSPTHWKEKWVQECFPVLPRVDINHPNGSQPSSSGRMYLSICKYKVTEHTGSNLYSLSQAHCTETMREIISTRSPRTIDFHHIFISSSTEEAYNAGIITPAFHKTCHYVLKTGDK